MWFDATGKRLPAPNFPGFDTMGTFKYILDSGHEYTWFILDQKIIEKEFALSGSEQNPDFTNRDFKLLLERIKKGAPGPVEAFKQKGADFVVRNNLRDLVDGMNALTDEPLLDYEDIEREMIARDREVDNKYSKDFQVTAHPRCP